MPSMTSSTSTELAIPPAVYAERVQEEALMRQPPPTLPANIIRSVKIRFGEGKPASLCPLHPIEKSR